MRDRRSEGRTFDAPPARPVRVRCVHCGMPVRGNLVDCWSCGLPALEEDAAPTERLATVAPPSSRRLRSARTVVVAVSAAIAVALVVGAVALLLPDDPSSTVRHLVDRARGDEWSTLRTATFSVDLAGPAVQTDGRATTPGQQVVGRQWQATSSDGRVQTSVTVTRLGAESAPTDAGKVADAAIDGVAEQLHVTATDRTSVTVLGSVGRDAVLTSATGEVRRVRAALLAGELYVLLVRGDARAFGRMTGSLRLTAA